MTDGDQAALIERLAEPEPDRTGAAFTASVLYRLGARRRRREWLVRTVLGFGLLASLLLLSPAIVRACSDLDMAPNAVIRLAAATVLLAAIILGPLTARRLS